MQQLIAQVQTLSARLQQAESRIKELEAEKAATPAPPPPVRTPASPEPRRASQGGGLVRAASFGTGPRRRHEAQRPQAQSPRLDRTEPTAVLQHVQRQVSSPRISRGGGSRVSTPGRKQPTKYFTASMRGGPLTEPLKGSFLTRRERDDPAHELRGPSLLLRKALVDKGFETSAVLAAIKQAQQKKRRVDPELDVFEEALQLLQTNPSARRHGNLLLDDNPWNDGINYWPFRGHAFPPSDYEGPGDHRQTDELDAELELKFVYGYRGDTVRSNLFYTKTGKVVYHAAAVGIVYSPDAHAQAFFHGHDDDIVSLAMHPNGELCATGQVRSLNSPHPRILVWSSETLQALQELAGFHQRAVICLSFSPDGRRLASIGSDNSHSIAIYESSKDTWDGKAIAEPLATDRGHNADIYDIQYNPVTSHVVACGKAYLRFFGLKENFSHHESPLWAKKAIMKGAGKQNGQADISCLAFGPDGATYAGTMHGEVYVFHEQQLSSHFVAHKGAVTALHYDNQPGVERLFSSGADGQLKAWQMPEVGSARARTASSRVVRWSARMENGVVDGVVDMVRAHERINPSSRPAWWPRSPTSPRPPHHAHAASMGYSRARRRGPLHPHAGLVAVAGHHVQRNLRGGHVQTRRVSAVYHAGALCAAALGGRCAPARVQRADANR